ncbi:MAG: recombination mediator RecR [bacterium]
MKFPKAITNLINELANWPTVGPKTAERFAFYLHKQSKESLINLAKILVELKERTTTCSVCFALAETNPCNICMDNKRDNKTICVVANYRDLISIDNTKQFNGKFFVLNGELSHLDGIGPEQLNIQKLVDNIQKNKTEELILALNPTIEGETTAMYLKKLLSPLNLRVTRLARGLPMGSDLEYVDELTLTNALKYRNDL